MSFLPSQNDLLLFASAAVILLIIPGPAVLYVLTRSIDQGRKAGLASCSGIATGTLVHVLGATLGLSATDSVWALAARSAGGWLRNNRTFVRDERYVSGTVYLGLGMATAVSGSRHK